MILLYGYYQCVPKTDEVRKIKFPSPKTLEQAALFTMKLNQEAEIYGCIYFLRQDCEVKSKWLS